MVPMPSGDDPVKVERHLLGIRNHIRDLLSLTFPDLAVKYASIEAGLRWQIIPDPLQL